MTFFELSFVVLIAMAVGLVGVIGVSLAGSWFSRNAMREPEGDCREKTLVLHGETRRVDC